MVSGRGGTRNYRIGGERRRLSLTDLLVLLYLLFTKGGGSPSFLGAVGVGVAFLLVNTNRDIKGDKTKIWTQICN